MGHAYDRLKPMIEDAAAVADLLRRADDAPTIGEEVTFLKAAAAVITARIATLDLAVADAEDATGDGRPDGDRNVTRMDLDDGGVCGGCGRGTGERHAAGCGH